MKHTLPYCLATSLPGHVCEERKQKSSFGLCGQAENIVISNKDLRTLLLLNYIPHLLTDGTILVVSNNVYNNSSQKKGQSHKRIFSRRKSPLSTLHLCWRHVLKTFFFSFIFGKDVHSTSTMKQLNSLSLLVLIDLVFDLVIEMTPSQKYAAFIGLLRKLWANINANIHLHHTQAWCGSLLLDSIALPCRINNHKNPVGCS